MSLKNIFVCVGYNVDVTLLVNCHYYYYFAGNDMILHNGTYKYFAGMLLLFFITVIILIIGIERKVENEKFATRIIYRTSK